MRKGRAELKLAMGWLQALGAALGDKAGHIDKATSEVAGEVKTAAGQVGQVTPVSSSDHRSWPQHMGS